MSPFIPYGKHYIDDDDIQKVVEILRSGWLTQGPGIEEFEKAMAEYTGADYAVAVSSGTAALHLAYLTAGIRPGKTVITTPNTFVSTANTALYLGASIKFADIDSATLNINPTEIDEICIQQRDVQAIVPVHFGGLACDMRKIMEIANCYKSIVVEDAAHALGGSYPCGSRIGSCKYSDMTVFSFHPVKSIAAGEGGMVTTNNEEFYRKLLRLRSHGINKQDDEFINKNMAFQNGEINPWYYEMQELGFNYRITDIQCGLAMSQLGKLDGFIEKRRKIANTYDNAFGNHALIKPIQVSSRDYSANHLYVLNIDFKTLELTRAQFMRELRRKRIGTQVHYIPIPSHPYYEQKGFKLSDYPETQSYYSQALSIPIYFSLSDKDINFVIETIIGLSKAV